MSIDEAIHGMQGKIKAVSKSAEIKVVKISAEEARLSVFVSAGDMQPIRETVLQPTLDYLNREGLDIQVLVYDKDSPPEIG